MKHYLFASTTGVLSNTVNLGTETFTVDLLGKNYKSVKVVSSCLSYEGSIQYGIKMRLHSYTGNGQACDRKSPVCAMYLYESTAGVETAPAIPPSTTPTIKATDFYHMQPYTPEYFISSTLNQLEFSFTGTFDAIIAPGDLHFEFMLELDSD
jgi:hypothetical protein